MAEAQNITQQCSIPYVPELSMNHLDELFLKYGTDKSSRLHDYASVYDNIFAPLRHTVKKVVEIGIFGVTPESAGASLRAWEEYFPAAHIYGVDLFDYSFVNTERIQTMVADQGTIDGLEHIIAVAGDDIDIIIDDGGHYMHQQQLSFGYLYKFLRNGGYYIIEDLQTSYDAGFNSTNTQYNSALMVELFKRTGIIVSDYISDEDKQHIQEAVKSCEIYKVKPLESELAVFIKGSSPTCFPLPGNDHRRSS
jgi:demethylmacrocin O-methyltransferase